MVLVKPITLVQAVTRVTGANSAAFGSNVTAGSLLLAMATVQSVGGMPATPTDTLTDTWSQQITLSGGSTAQNLMIASAIAGSSGANTVTFVPGSGSVKQITLYELAGFDPNNPIGVSGASSTGSTSTPSVTLTPTTPNAAIFLLGMLQLSTTWATTDSGFTASNGSNGVLDEYLLNTGSNNTGVTMAPTTGGFNGWLIALAINAAQIVARGTRTPQGQSRSSSW